MKTVKIFLASSNELEAERQAFADFIARKSDNWEREKGIALKLKIWERASDALSPTRLQDEYNKLIRDSEIFVLLAHTKVGKYTEEEFDIALDEFGKTSKRSKILLYFKKLTAGTATEESLGKFQARLRKLEHFPAYFDDSDSLENQFSDELDMIAADWRAPLQKLDLGNKTFILSPLEDQSVIEKILLPELEKAGIPLHLDFRNFTLDHFPYLSQTIRACRKTLLVSSTSVTKIGRLFIESFRAEQSEETLGNKLLPLQLSGDAQFPELPNKALDISDAATLEQNLQALVERLRRDFGLEALKKTWPPLPPEFVDAGRLPQGGVYVQLFGRQQELALLDQCWEKNEVRILSFTANGGVGKSQLVNRWVNDMKADNFRGAERVFAWTFYSQGTGDKTTSADRFIQTALEWFDDPDPLLGSPWERGKRLATLAAQHRSLILLDGLEPLQYPADLLRGKLKDPALEMFLKTFAKQSQGLCVVTTRVPLAGLERAAERLQQHDLEVLSPEACSVILRTRGVSGSEDKIRQAALNFGCHALAINLLAEYLHALPAHPIEAADHIPDLPDVPPEKGKHPRRVIEALFRQLLEKGKNDEAHVLQLLGLFDRAISEEALETVTALLPQPLNLPKTLAALRRLKLLYETSDHAPDEVDCHPLIREHFEAYLQTHEPELFRAAHERLYEYYKNLPEKELPDTLEEMEPLFYAIAHGCRAGKQEEALVEVYWGKIIRQKDFINSQLGAFGSDLTALAHFFERVWDKPSKSLPENDQAVMLNWAGFALRALGRLREAAEVMKANLDWDVAKKDRLLFAAIGASNLSELYLTAGEVAEAVKYGQLAVQYADKSEEKWKMIGRRTGLADALFQSGNLENALTYFEESEKILREYNAQYRYLLGIWGYRYCDLLIEKGEYEGLIERAMAIIESAEESNDSLLTKAVGHLSLGSAYFAKQQAKKNSPLEGSGEADKWFNEAVEGLRKAGSLQHLPLGLLARAAWHRYEGRYAEAYEDLEEVLEIAESGGMRLFLVDYHIEMARLLQTQSLVPTSPPTPPPNGRGDVETAAWHKAEALRLIGETGYKRRLKEAEAL